MEAQKTHSNVRMPEVYQGTGFALFACEPVVIPAYSQYSVQLGFRARFPAQVVVVIVGTREQEKAGVQCHQQTRLPTDRDDWVVVLANTTSQSFAVPVGTMVGHALMVPTLHPVIDAVDALSG